MFNSPILDVTIGLVFIFLLYSLLVTSLNEGISTLFSLRARMLKKAIIKGMLSDTPDDSTTMYILKSFRDGILAVPYRLVMLFRKNMKPVNKNIGDTFFDHPLIKSYGSSRVFPLPSYISAKIFATVFIDILKTHYLLIPVEKKKLNNPDIMKIRDLLEYYNQLHKLEDGSQYTGHDFFIEAEPVRILQMYLHESYYEMAVFRQKVEIWYTDTMDRVSGWYKRQTQLILFLLGIVIAIAFNVDTLKIAGKLSTDKDAREDMVKLAMTEAENYQNDPRINKILLDDGRMVPDTSRKNQQNMKAVYREYQQRMDDTKKILDGDVNKVNQIIALGWNVEKLTKPVSRSYYVEGADRVFDSIKNMVHSLHFSVHADSARMHNALLNYVHDKISPRYVSVSGIYLMPGGKIKLTGERGYYPVEMAEFILLNTFTGTKWLGFLITALAICLGAPFWFDLLNKLVRLRTSGKRDDTADVRPAAPEVKPAVQSSTAKLVSVSKNGDEAIG